jgi:high-affinity iron transporter
VETALSGFRAAPLSPSEQARRAGQMLRFLDLVPVEYRRGVRNGRVAIDLEIREAVTFRDGAAAAFTDLRPLIEARDPATTTRIAALFGTLERDLASANDQAAPDPDSIQSQTDQLVALLRQVMPAEWQQRDNAADFDVIRTALDQMEQAARAGQYDLAESARLEAYAILESGPEVKLIVFAPQYKVALENLFWYGQDAHKGLAYLLERRAPHAEIEDRKSVV